MTGCRMIDTGMNIASFRVSILLLATLPLAALCNAQSRQLTEVAPLGLGFRPEFRQEGSYRVMTNESIAAVLNRVAPRLVDSSGGSLGKTPGLVVGFVTESGPEVLSFGTKMIGREQPPDGNTYFALGSVTKIFTGFVLAKAVADGVVSVDDSANRYLPAQLKLRDSAITLRTLVTHTSGLPNFPENITAFRDLDEDGKNDSVPNSPGRNYTRELLADFLRTEGQTEFKPGTREQYSNLGSGILSVVLQEKLGLDSFEKLNERYVTGPLGMRNTAANTPEMLRKYEDNKAQGYAVESDRLVPVPFSDMGILEGAGELVSTANDLIRLLEALTGLRKTSLAAAFDVACEPLFSLGEDQMAYGFRVRHSSKGGVDLWQAGRSRGLFRDDPLAQNPPYRDRPVGKPGTLRSAQAARRNAD